MIGFFKVFFGTIAVIIGLLILLGFCTPTVDASDKHERWERDRYEERELSKSLNRVRQPCDRCSRIAPEISRSDINSPKVAVVGESPFVLPSSKYYTQGFCPDLGDLHACNGNPNCLKEYSIGLDCYEKAIELYELEVEHLNALIKATKKFIPLARVMVEVQVNILK